MTSAEGLIVWAAQFSACCRRKFDIVRFNICVEYNISKEILFAINIEFVEW